MAAIQHRRIQPGDIHSIVNWEVNDLSELENIDVGELDIYRTVRVLDYDGEGNPQTLMLLSVDSSSVEWGFIMTLNFDEHFDYDGVNIKISSVLRTKLNKVDSALQASDLNGYATEEWVGSRGYQTNSNLAENYATTSWVNKQGFLKTHQSLSSYATRVWVEGKGYIPDAPDDGNYYVRKGKRWEILPDLGFEDKGSTQYVSVVNQTVTLDGIADVYICSVYNDSAQSTIKLPPNPRNGMVVEVYDAANLFDVNKCVVEGNGESISVASSKLDLDARGMSRTFKYIENETISTWVVK